MRRIVVSLGMLAILGVMVAPALGATPQNAKGSVGLSGPSQSVWFSAFETTPANGARTVASPTTTSTTPTCAPAAST